MSRRPVEPGRMRTLVGFAAFGLFWGSWGAVLPAVQSHADVSDGTLGLALLCVGAGALVSMRGAGAAVDRWGSVVLPVAIVAFAASAVVTAFASTGVALAGALLLLGAGSGAFDVAINAEGVRVEATGRRVLNLAHATFSAGVVVASLLTGALRTTGADSRFVLTSVGVLLAFTAIGLRRLPSAPAARHTAPASASNLLRIPGPLAILGALAALAYLVENAWQSWSALHLESTLHASVGVASVGPAVFATAVVAGRLSAQRLSKPSADRVMLGAGAALGGAGTLLAATAPTTSLALLGIAIAGLGTSVCAPTLISLAGRVASPQERGAAVSAVTTLGYLGFLLGPAAVGLAADAANLRIALAGVAGVALLLATLARFAPVRRRDWAGIGSRPQ